MDVPKLNPRKDDSHKGTYGRALIIGGSRGMTGAVALAGMAAARSGAGLITVAVPDRCVEAVACYDPCYMTVSLADDGQGRLARGHSQQYRDIYDHFTNIGIGPGLSRSAEITQVVAEIYREYTGPMVVDADALNAMAQCPSGLSNFAGPRILTPHLGEFRRLTGESLEPETCRQRAVDLAKDNKIVVVLKGHRTLVTDGKTTYENQTGNPGMATGGSGDVLTGVITSLLGQDLSPLEAATLGVHVHGLAGDLACDEIGEVSMIASDILEYLPEAFQALS